MTTIASSTSTNTNYSRISGLASGLDVDGIVESLMKAARVPLDKLQQQRQVLEWQQEGYRSLNSSLYDFKNTVYDMKLQSTYNPKTVASSSETVVSASAASSAINGTYTIRVNNLAAGVSKGSSSALAEETDEYGARLSLFQQFSEFADRGLIATDNITVNINGTDLEFDLDQDSISTVVSKINAADLGVRASYDSSLNRFFLTTLTTGSEAHILVSADSANFLAGGSNDSILKLSINQGSEYQGENASIDFGDAVGIESETNTMVVNGITLKLRAEGTANVVISQDVEAVMESIQTFVDTYNANLDQFYAKVQEDRDLDYPPLTDEQKKEMSDEEIAVWNKKANCGLLANDSMLNNLISSLRQSANAFVTGIPGDYNSLNEIGISTRSYLDNGKLYLDETKLREALSRDPEGVMQMFTDTNEGSEGIAVRLYNAAATGITMLSNKAGSSTSISSVDVSYIGKRLSVLADAIEDWEDKLDSIETRYYAKFDAMETAINTMNTQSQWLASQFG